MKNNLKIDLKSNGQIKDNSEDSLTASKMSKISKALNGIKTVSNQKSLYSSKDQNKIIKDKINYTEKLKLCRLWIK